MLFFLGMLQAGADSTEQKSNTFKIFLTAAVKSRTNVRGNIKRTFLFMIFARKRTQSVWRILPPPKCAKHKEAESEPLHNHQASGLASEAVRPSPPRRGRTVPSALTQPAEADVQEAQAGGASFSQLNLKRREKERFSQLVKNKPRVIQKSG